MKQYNLFLLLVLAAVLPNNLNLGLDALQVGKERLYDVAEKVPAFHSSTK